MTEKPVKRGQELICLLEHYGEAETIYHVSAAHRKKTGGLLESNAGLVLSCMEDW